MNLKPSILLGGDIFFIKNTTCNYLLNYFIRTGFKTSIYRYLKPHKVCLLKLHVNHLNSNINYAVYQHNFSIDLV